jgi:hypothetical protein
MAVHRAELCGVRAEAIDNSWPCAVGESSVVDLVLIVARCWSLISLRLW